MKWWGGKGSGPGQFNVPHTSAIDGKGLLYVGDRSNNRVQVFDQSGQFIEQWTNFGTLWGVFIRGNRFYLVDGTENNRLLIVNLADGRVLERIDGLSNPTGVAVDSKNAIYIAQVNGMTVKKSAYRASGLKTPGCRIAQSLPPCSILVPDVVLDRRRGCRGWCRASRFSGSLASAASIATVKRPDHRAVPVLTDLGVPPARRQQA